MAPQAGSPPSVVSVYFESAGPCQYPHEVRRAVYRCSAAHAGGKVQPIRGSSNANTQSDCCWIKSGRRPRYSSVPGLTRGDRSAFQQPPNFFGYLERVQAVRKRPTPHPTSLRRQPLPGARSGPETNSRNRFMPSAGGVASSAASEAPVSARVEASSDGDLIHGVRGTGNRKNLSAGNSGTQQGTDNMQRQRNKNTGSDIASQQKDYVRRIKGAGLQGSWQEIPKLLSEMRAKNTPRNAYVYNTAIAALARCRRPLEAEALLAYMVQRDDTPPDQISYNSAINAHARCGNLDASRRLLEQMRESVAMGLGPDVITFNSVADAAAKRGNAAAATEVLAIMAEDGVSPDIITYNACLAACRPKGDLRRASALFELMREDGIEPDQRSYSAIIAAAGRRGEWAQVSGFMEEMRRDGLSPDKMTFNNAITAMGASGQWEAAGLLLVEMRAAGLPPDAMSYTSALKACGRAGEWQAALRLLREMADAGVAPNAFSYSAAMDACGKAGRQQEALSLLAEMRRVRIRPDAVAYNSAIDACSVAGDWATALKLLLEMKEGTDAAPPPDVVSYGGAVTACARGGRVNEALDLVRELQGNEARVKAMRMRGEEKGKGLPVPNLVVYSSALFACLKAGEVERGGMLLEDMMSAGIQPNGIHCATMIAAWSAAGEPERALVLMKRLQSTGFTPALGTYEALVWGFAQTADWEAAIRLLSWILGQKLTPSARSWDAAIAACSQAGHWERALALLAEMRRQGVRPSRVTYTAAVAGLNRPRFSEWGPKLENLARLLQHRPEDDEVTPASPVSTDTGGTGGADEVAVERGVAGGGGGRPPAPEDYDTSIEALGDAGNAGGAACLLRVMRKEGFHASPRAYRSVIYALARVGHLSEAIALAKEMESCSSVAAVGMTGGKVREQLYQGSPTLVVTDNAASSGRRRSTARAAAGCDSKPSEAMAGSAEGSTGFNEIAEDAQDGSEFDMAVVYNCIVCNFARAACADSVRGGSRRGNVNGDNHHLSICENRPRMRAEGMKAVRASRADIEDRVISGAHDVPEEDAGSQSGRGGGGDGAGLVAHLLGVADRSEGSLAEEASKGGVAVASVEGGASTP